MRLYIFLGLFLASSISYKSEKKTDIKLLQIKQTSDIDPYFKAKNKTYNWINNLHFDLNYISNKKLGEKKFLAEYLGFYWKLYKNTNDQSLKAEIKQKLQSYYKYTHQKKYHNMALVNDKLFKKNSMSYLRVMWLLKQLDFNISYYQIEVNKIMKRMNTHLKLRGAWQKEVFKEYYKTFDFTMPQVLVKSHLNNGIIDEEIAFEKYTRNNAYSFTHFVFAGFEYGFKTKQNRFSEKNLLYIKEILPKFTKYYRETKPNIDLLGEFVTCMVYMGFTNSEEFSKSYQYIIKHQNTNGSWGSYEKYRKKIGNDIDFRAYLHTTLVVFESLITYKEGDFKGSI